MTLITLPIDDMKIILSGCPRHAPYRGLKRPNAECDMCKALYDAVQRLLSSQLSEAGVNYVPDPRCLLCYGDTPHTAEQHWRELTALHRG